MHSTRVIRWRRKAGLIVAGGLLFQAGSCDLGTFSATTTTTTTLDGRQVIIGLLRGAILTPIDAFITNAVNELFDQNQ